MALCGFFAFVVGYLLGLRFRVMVVIPAEIATCAVALTLVLLGRVGVGQTCIGVVIASIALQCGYALALACPVPARRAIHRDPAKA